MGPPSEAMDYSDEGAVWIRPPAPAEILYFHQLLLAEVSPHGSSLDTMMAVHTTDSFWIVEHPAPVGAPRVLGLKPIPGESKLVFSDHHDVEIVADQAPHRAPITMESDPYLIIRPEGEWDIPGVLEQSSMRPVTSPY